MDSLREYLKAHPKIFVTEESKLFYGKFPFRVLVRTKPQVRRPKILTEWLKGRNIQKGHYRVQRYDPRGLNVYLRTAEECLALFETLGSDIRAFSMPEDEAHLDVLVGEEDVEIRKHLYWHRFRYMAVCRWLGKDVRRDVETWINEVFGEDSPDCMLGSSYPMKIYFIDHKATALFKLAHSPSVRKIYRVVLHSEILSHSVSETESSSDHDA